MIGVTLAATFFAGINIKANVAAEQTLDNHIKSVVSDMTCHVSLNKTNVPVIADYIQNMEYIKYVDYTATFWSPAKFSSDNYTSTNYCGIVSFSNNSRVYNGWLNKPPSEIPTNYTYILEGSSLEKKLSIGDNITTLISFPSQKYGNTTIYYLNLTVAGVAKITDEGYAVLTGTDRIYTGNTKYRGEYLLVSWENTLEPLWENVADSAQSIIFAINVDRDALISPWNVQASETQINVIADNIENKILSYISWAYVNNALGQALQGYDSNISSYLFSYFMVSIPIFFVAWYLGSTVSDVSFNIRRREIGLLSTKGLSSGQIQRMFLAEAVVIGLMGGILGLIGGLIINQYYAGTVNLNTLFASKLYSPDVMIATVIFGVVLALISVFLSSRRASRIPVVEALRNDPTITLQSHRRIIPVIALAIGSYSIIVALLGINVPSAYQQWLYTSGNIFLRELYPIVSYFDQFMTYFGFFFFLWGLTTIIIRDSTKFQAVATKIYSFMGDLGALAAKNVRRNPVRLTAVAFVVALIICLSVQVTGQVASQQDYIQRSVAVQVGSDVTVTLANASEGQIVLRELLLNVSGIQNATVERILTPSIGGGMTTVRAIDPDSWMLAAYYEEGWFSGNNVNEIMRLMKGDNNTIVISRALAKQLNKELYDTIAVDFRSCPRTLKIVGFFGPEPTDYQGVVPLPVYVTRDSSAPTFTLPTNVIVGGAYNSPYDCYVPRDLFNCTGADSEIYQLESFTTTILIKLKPGANGTQVANQIRDLDLAITSVNSYDEQWRSTNQMENSATFSSMQTLDIQNFGLMFVVISASIGTCLIAVVSLKERNREATLMSVRGLSYRQLVWVFLVESFAIITFAVIIGAIVGVVLVYGAVASTNSVTATWSFSLISQRLIFPPDAVATIATYAGLIYAATIGAIIVMSSQYVTKLEKMVRTR